MNPRERVLTALRHRKPDRVPRFEIWIDALYQELGAQDAVEAAVKHHQDCIMMPTSMPPDSSAWKDGVDEWGRIWKGGVYLDGRVKTREDLATYTPPLDYMKSFYEADRISEVRRRHPDHCLIFGTHIGPFTATFMAMGFEHFFISLFDNPSFVHAVLEARTEWCVAMYQEALAHGAEVLVLGEDAGSSQGSMISPVMWREFIYPYHCRIVEALDAPLIWHSDGNVMSLLPMAIEAGFIGFHGMDPMAGMDLGTVKKEFGRDLVLVGNVDVRVLCGTDLSAVRHEVDRCLEAIGSEGGYMIATCNSIFEGMNPEAVIEMFEYEGRSGL